MDVVQVEMELSIQSFPLEFLVCIDLNEQSSHGLQTAEAPQDFIQQLCVFLVVFPSGVLPL
jgi:hypothetical protein